MRVTGSTCQQSGVFSCLTHSDNTIPLPKGETLPPCSRDGGDSSTWILVRPA